ncbi:thiamine diphosphokinase [Ornithinibacillus gellani]|uniref:thiamine diphosphokinase n=1 Tax=Ornithinibacillus gellani TaxID=2293253 RepID=UPI000F4A4D9B|nr:thiamine diphosphokinase [Ornithinibacillus gellani]TQS75606.1 thiamine diphosphokinase [Ornithinibacillus gellani]
MTTIGIVANGPASLLPNLNAYRNDVDVWIGADRGALSILQSQLPLSIAIGDFDSVAREEFIEIEKHADTIQTHPSMKDETDLELALQQAFKLHPDAIFLFGATGGRLDHMFINMQTLILIQDRGITGILIDKDNYVEVTKPGMHQVMSDSHYTHISFIPATPVVEGLTLTGFLYPLEDTTLTMGSTLCISNKLQANSGTFFYKEGILLLIKSRDASENTILR